MNVSLTWTGLGVIATLLIHAAIVIRGWTIIEMRLKSMSDAFIALNNSLEKRDARIDAAWKKIDRHENRLTIIETKNGIHHVESD